MESVMSAMNTRKLALVMGLLASAMTTTAVLADDGYDFSHGRPYYSDSIHERQHFDDRRYRVHNRSYFQDRLIWQADRIRQGERSGQLTRHEATDLWAEHRHLRYRLDHMVWDDNRLDRYERQRLESAFDAADRHIFNEKHDWWRR